MSRPSTPSGRSNLMEKLFNKIRTPTSSSGGAASSSTSANGNHAQGSIGASSSSPFSLSTPSVLRRNSSRSSFHCGGSSAMASTSSLASNSSSLAAGALGALDFEDDNDVPLPEFESDAYLSNASWNNNGSSVKASSPTFPSSSSSTSRTAVNAGAGAISQPRPSFSSSGGRPSFDQLDGPLNNPPRSSSSMSRHSPPLPFSNPLLRSNTSANSGGGSGSSSGIGSVGVDSSGDGMRKSTFISRAAASASGSSSSSNLRTLARSWTKSKEKLTGSGTLLARTRADLVNGAEGEDGAAHAEDARRTNEIDSRSSPTLASSMSHSRATLERRTSNDRILSASQPALSTFATTTPALPRPGLTASTKATGERTGGRGWLERKSLMQSQTGTGGTEVKKRRAQRVNLQELMAKKEREGLEGAISDAGDHGESASESNASPPLRPPLSPHNRSRSEVTPSSPRLVSKDRAAATVTIVSSSSTSYARPGSSLSQYNTSSSTDTSPPTLGSSTRSRSTAQTTTTMNMTSSTNAVTAPKVPSVPTEMPESSTMLRQRFLVSRSSTPSETSSGPSPSPPLPPSNPALENKYRLPSMSPPERGAEGRPESPSMMTYAARRGASIDGGNASMSREETIMALPPRAASSIAMYRDETPAQPIHHANYASSSLPSRSTGGALPYVDDRAAEYQAQNFPARPGSAMELYHDENAYSSSRTATTATTAAPVVAPTTTNGRTVLGETYRAANIGPPLTTANGRQYPPSSQPFPTKPTAVPAPVEYQVPLRDRSPGMAEVTPVALYHQQQQQQHYAQQQQQQQAYDPQMERQLLARQYQQAQQQHHMTQPLKPAKKSPQCIIVNNKPYARAGLLGRGGSSRVYRVLDEKNQLFAIKKVDISKNDAESRQSFANEISLLEKLRGKPQIIQLIDSEIGENKRHLLMVMEQGETDLNNLLNEHSGKKISMNFIRYIWEGMLEAVHVIHNENVVHTDLKPANFVLVKGRLKLIDFGISKTIANDTTNIGRDQQIGTANYMPPEALIDSGMGRDGKRLMKLGRAADVWSLGCILHQMVYGRTPFAHIRDIGQKIMAIQNPNYKFEFAPTTTPVDERGVEIADLQTELIEEVLETLELCLKFDPKTRATIPELLGHPFLRKPAPPIREEDLHWLVQSVTKLVTGKQLDETDMPKVSDKLMKGLIGRARGRVYDRYK
ncbi:BQ5605_C012g06799 [Microbotryum silenes-dioicae]|uniref:BQ5605_C012g06799 protein n=1 Tax=Microbotryum silenes-dioicae TaxID=796604 RepID=A0A2X0MLJ9_9BASI|nr:BQ5605_C012g06799 [Microbotryum silenes-dioicae]